MIQSCTAVIDCTALQYNLQQVRLHAPCSQVLAMIKGNAYGHGLFRVAAALRDADAFGLARFSEAIKLREAGVMQRLVVLEGFTNSCQLDLVDRYQLELVVHDISQIESILQYDWQQPVKLWIKIDTGMGRLGMKPDVAKAAWQRLANVSGKIQPDVCMTHFAQAQWPFDPKTPAQIRVFNDTCHDWPIAKSLANSAGILCWPNAHADWVRPGIMLYGVSPLEHHTGNAIGLRPAMTLQTILIAVRDFNVGDTIGYDSTFVCPKAMRVGVAAVGYADGYPRYIKPRTPILVNGFQTTVLGRVSMDMISIDLSSLQAVVGDRVTLWGDGLPVEVIASHADTSAYELLSGITERVLYV